jgi:tetratricopeptide (TPR) repeat protein
MDLEQIVSLSDGHPFNVNFLVGTAIEYTLPVALADTTELTQWKRRHGSEFLRNIEFSEEEEAILAALRDFSILDFSTIHGILGGEIAAVGKALTRLMDFHVIEAAGSDTYQVAPPLRTAVGRDNRFTLDPDRTRAMLKVISDSLMAHTEADEISVSMIDAGILAALQEGTAVSPFFSAFLLPSHLVWLARRHYDGKRWAECARLTLAALESVNRLSPAGKVEACRLLCLSSARLNRQDDFQKGIAMLRTWADDSWARSNVHFQLGFNARLDGNLLQAEAHFREAYGESPGNPDVIRELAAICMIRGELDQAETFARKAIDPASDNPYILDILLRVLIACPPNKLREHELEISYLFETLKSVGEDEGRSFYTTRRAEYELKHGRIDEACHFIDAAALKTPGIFAVHALRAKIYLERGLKTVAKDEIEKIRRVVYRNQPGDRRSNLRALLEIEASYLAATGDYNAAKEIYGRRTVFTEEEAQVAIRTIDYEQAMRRNAVR